MHEQQGAEYEYSAPISVTLTTPGNNFVQIPSPLAGDAEYLVEYINATTADASVYISADATMNMIPSGGAVLGYLLNGASHVTPKDVYSPVASFVTIVGNVGASNSAINVCLRFRRAMVVEIPVDIEHPNNAFTDS